MTPFKIIRHPAVQNDLFDILDLIATYAGVEIALRKLGEIEETIKSLESRPFQGSIRNEIHSNLRAVPTARKGVICFFVDKDKRTVEIVAIAYAGADWSNMVSGRSE